MIRDLESDSGLLPVSPMDGIALPTPGKSDDGDDDADAGTDKRKCGSDCGDNTNKDNRDGRDYLRKKLRKKIEMLERRRRVGYTVDMSVNLGNSSHFDVHDASQGYSVWTEEIRGLGANWYFVMPNLHGTRPDGRTFAGIAIRLGHGVAISWDGRVIRHCTSLSMPDGIDGKRVGGGKKCFKNHLYGTFTAAKENGCAGRKTSVCSCSGK